MSITIIGFDDVYYRPAFKITICVQNLFVGYIEDLTCQSTHVLINLLNELGKKKGQNCRGQQMLYSVYHMKPKTTLISRFGRENANTLSFTPTFEFII